MSIISYGTLVVVVAFLAGLEGILDPGCSTNPLFACTLIGLVTGNLTAGIMLGGSLQFITWLRQVVPAVAPDAAAASVAAAIIMVLGRLQYKKESLSLKGVAIPLAVAGL